MKEIINKTYSLMICLTLGIWAFSCDVSQDWEVDSSFNKLFSPVSFQTSNVSDTMVELSFTRVIGARKYIFELSEGDSTLSFNNIKQRIEISADTLTAYAPNTTATKVEYRKRFSGLFGETAYSVRLIAVNADSSLQSKYSTIKFTTLAEQLFKVNSIGMGLDSIFLKWNQTDKVSHIVMHPVGASDNTQDIRRTLTPQEITTGEASFLNLGSGTNYQFTIYYNTIKRGQVIVSTLGLANSVTYTVSPSDNATTISQAISSIAANNNRNINIYFESGKTYSLTGLTIPDGVDKIKFTGQPDIDGTLPAVTLNGIVLGSATSSLIEATFENISINGNAAYFCVTVPNPIASLKTISFNGCDIHNFARGVISVSNVALAIDNISIINSFIKKIGGYGIVNVSGSNALVTNITYQYCTLSDISTHFADFRTGANFNMLNCTVFNNNTTGYTLSRFIRSNDAAPFPLSLNVQKCIIAGANNGATSLVGITYKTATNTAILPVTSFAGSYSTSEFPLQYASTVSTNYPGLQILTLSSSALFTDPANGDFSINSGVVFAGKNIAGDPRWFSE